MRRMRKPFMPAWMYDGAELRPTGAEPRTQRAPTSALARLVLEPVPLDQVPIFRNGRGSNPSAFCIKRVPTSSQTASDLLCSYT